MKIVTTLSGPLHALMDLDWHGWLLLFGALGASWVLAILITATLFAGSRPASQPVLARRANSTSPTQVQERRHA